MQSSTPAPVRRIVIVGGGSAGWIVAGVLAAKYPTRGEEGISITLLESRAHPPIGVGEGTWPTIRTTLRQIGVSETDFVRQCDASFKQGSQFAGWVDGNEHSSYLHPFTPPVSYDTDLLAPYWLEQSRAASSEGSSSTDFAEAVCFQTAPCLAGRAPKRITSAEYAGATNYAYHLNAGKFGGFLHAHCTSKLGVIHVLDEWR
jgi:tryptophan halogenase